MKIVIVGAGPTGLFSAFLLLKNSQHEVHLYDQMPSAGRKFLVAGKSGLNLTHSQNKLEFSKNYFNHHKLFLDWFEAFNSDDLVQWAANDLGIETFVGSSGRVFPKEFKAAQMLKIWMDKLKSNEKFKFFPNSKLNQVNKESLVINNEIVEFDRCILALGGGSWKKTGSDGMWVNSLREHNIKINNFESLNCGFNIKWKDGFLKPNERIPLKYIKAYYQGQSIKGDLMLTDWGIEGGPVYFLSHFIQEDRISNELKLDLCPDLSVKNIDDKLNGKKSVSTKLKSFMDPNAIRLLKTMLSKDDFLNTDSLASHIKNLSLKLISARDIDESISTRGGVDMSEVNSSLQLKKLSSIYIGGEMLDWDAPTGGYLLQGCFTQGYIISKAIISP